MPTPVRRCLVMAVALAVLLLAGLTRAPGQDLGRPADAPAVLAAAGTDTEAPDWTAPPVIGDSNPSVLATTAPPEASAPARPRPQRREQGKRPPPRRTAYLTFDDGPSDWTPAVLRILTRHRATATFFVLGAQAELRPRMLRQIRRQGSSIGNHTVTHPQLTRLSDKQVRWQLATGPRSRCFRPPYGATSPRVVRIARGLGMRQVLWSADSRDWELPGRRAITAKALLGLRPGAIILMHDGGGDRAQTVAALPGLLDELHRRGYRVRALPGCNR